MIKISSPTRVDLAGGTLDMWPLHSFLGPSWTINGAISIFTHVELTPRLDSKISIEFADIDIKEEFPNREEFLFSKNLKYQLVKEIVAYFLPDQGFKLKTSSESPVGGGLGGSSSLIVSLYKSFSQWLPHKKKSLHEIVHLLHNLEARILRTPTGTQDYYPPLTGGLMGLCYSDEGVERISLSTDLIPIHEKAFLVNTGRSHHSGLNNFDVLSRAVKGDREVLGALKSLQEVSLELITNLKSQKKIDWLSLFSKEIEFRLKLSPEFSSPEIDQLLSFCKKQEQVGLKILGAGGGGCVLVWSEKQSLSILQEQIQNLGFDIKPIHWVQSFESF